MADTKLNAREKAALEEQKKDRKVRAQFIVVGLIVVVLAALVIVVNSSLFTNTFAALKVTDGTTVTKYALADVNYAYQSSYMQMYNSYGSYGLIDNKTPLSEQQSLFGSEGETWDDYFKDAAQSSLVEQTAFGRLATAAGYTQLTEEEQADLDSMVDNLKTYAAMYGYADVNGYIALNYGAGNNEKTLRENMTKSLLVGRYLQDTQNSFTYTDEELDAYYTENRNDLSSVNYVYTLISAQADEDAGIDEEAAMADALEKAEHIAQHGAEGEEAFRDAVAEVTGSQATETSGSISGFLNLYEGDVTEDALTAGTVFTHETGSAVYAVYVLGLEENDYSTVNVRHILVRPEDTDSDGSISEEERQAAYDAIKAIEDEWLAGEATEDSFAVLANLRSEDGGSNTNGGLYENIYKGQMVQEFNDFCFAPHQSGDTGIVYNENTGYHLIYFVGESGQSYRHVLAENALRSEDFDAFYNEAREPYTAERTFMWRYVMKG